jgi:hypothetical protein
VIGATDRLCPNAASRRLGLSRNWMPVLLSRTNVWQQNIGSKETAMPTRRFYRIALAHPLDGRMRTRVCRLRFDQIMRKRSL